MVLAIAAGSRWFRTRFSPDGRVSQLHMAVSDLVAVCGYRVPADKVEAGAFSRHGAYFVADYARRFPNEICRRCLPR